MALHRCSFCLLHDLTDFAFFICDFDLRTSYSMYKTPGQMARSILVIIAISSFQYTEAQNFSLGIKAGPTATWANFPDADVRSQFSSGVKLGYMMGGVIQFPLKKRYSFTAEFAYAQKGRKVKFNDDTWQNNATYHFMDFSMALKRSYNIRIRKDIESRIFFNIGPNIEYWIDGKGAVSTDAISSSYTVVFEKQPDSNFNYNYLNNVNRWLFGLDIGIGADANITKTQRLHTELRFTYGHTYLGAKNSSSHIEILGFEDNLQANLKTLSLTVSYMFDFDLKKSKMGRSTKDREIRKKR